MDEQIQQFITGFATVDPKQTDEFRQLFLESRTRLVSIWQNSIKDVSQ